MGESAGGLLLWELSGQLIVWVSGRQSLELSKLGWAGLAWGVGVGVCGLLLGGVGVRVGKEDGRMGVFLSCLVAWSVWVRGGAPLPGVPGLLTSSLVSSLASRLVRSLFGSPSCLSINRCWTFLWVCAYHFSHPSFCLALSLPWCFLSFLPCLLLSDGSFFGPGLSRMYFLVLGGHPLTPTYRICCVLLVFFVLQHLD